MPSTASSSPALRWLASKTEIDFDQEWASRPGGDKGLRYFIREGWRVLEPPGRPFVDSWHIGAICEHLTAITQGHLRRLVINVPPGTSKSTQCCVYWQAWEWGPMNMPYIREITASHNEALAIRDATKLRRLLQSDWYQRRWGDRWSFNRDENMKTRFSNNHTGFRMVASVGGATGERGDRFVIDDPHQVQSGESDQIRSEAVRWIRETVPTRLNDPEHSAIVLIMQRVHEGDCSGEVLEQMQGWEHLMLPMRFEPERCCYTHVHPGGTVEDRPHRWDTRTEDGQLLDADRFPEHVVAELEANLGSYASAGQLQQRPTARGGGMIQVERMEIVDDYPRDARMVRCWDTAATEKKSTGHDPDFTAGVKACMRDGVTWIVDVNKDRKTPAGVEAMIRQTTAVDGYGVEVLLKQEPGSTGKMMIDHYQRNVLRGYTVRVTPDTQDKVLRADPFAAAVENGNVRIVRGDWNQAFIGECRTFPFGRHDDQVDAAADAWTHLNRPPSHYVP